MKYTTSPELRPPPHIYGDEWERSSDPWHKSQFPTGLEWVAPDQSDTHKNGWMAVDNWGNQIGFVADGTEVEATPKQILCMKQDMQDALMQMGATTAIESGLYSAAEAAREGK